MKTHKDIPVEPNGFIEVKCDRCGKTGRLQMTERGYMPDPRILRERGWYFSNKNDCFRCSPCFSAYTSETFKKIVKLCDDKGINLHII